MRHRTRRRGAWAQRGAVLVELTIVAPVLLLLVLMAFEVGMGIQDQLTVSSATRAGARVGSSAGVVRLADHEVLRAVDAGLADIDPADIQLVVVFKPDANGQMDPACRAASRTGLCNRYTAADLARPASDFTGTSSCTGSSPDRAWCPLDRERDQAAVAGPDWFGVHVQIRHRSLAQAFIGDRLVTNTTVMRLEPRFQP